MTAPSVQPMGSKGEAVPTVTQQQREADQAEVDSSPAASSGSGLLRFLPVLICALPSILLLLFVPPTFNMRDSATMLGTPVSYLVPHWPPLYPEFLLFNTSIFGMTNLGVYAAIVEQHLLAIVAGVYICFAYSDIRRRTAMALLFAVANYFFVLSHGIYTEALSTALLLFFIGAAVRLAVMSTTDLDTPLLNFTVELPEAKSRAAKTVRIALTQRSSVLLISYISLVLMTLTRHNMFIFAALLPSYYILRFILRAPGAGIRAILASIVAGLLAFAVVEITNESTCRLLGSDSSPKFGRPAVNRMHDLPWNTIPADERAHLLANMQKRCPDDITKMALNFMIHDSNPWKGSYDQIEALRPSFHCLKSTDQIMNDAAKAFMLTPNKYLTREIVNAFNNYMGDGNVCMQTFVGDNAPSIQIYRTANDVLPQIKSIPLLQQIDVSQYKRLSLLKPKYFDAICRYIPIAVLAMALSIVAVTTAGASLDSLAVVLALAVAAFLYAAISAAITVVVPRYLAPVNAVAWIMLAVSILSFRKIPSSFSKGKGINRSVQKSAGVKE